jgi:hypothetical protein
MPERLLLNRFSLLWVAIATQRVLLHLGITFHLSSPLVLNALYLTFAVAIVIAEFLILRDFLRPPETAQITSTRDVSRPLRRPRKWFVGLMMFCLPFGLWESRNEFTLMATFAILVGSAMNLGFTWAACLPDSAQMDMQSPQSH